MGMLMHHTWLEQQKQAEKSTANKREEIPVNEETELEVPVKKTGGRRKVYK